jgi:hypothetical protein
MRSWHERKARHRGQVGHTLTASSAAATAPQPDARFTGAKVGGGQDARVAVQQDRVPPAVTVNDRYCGGSPPGQTPVGLPAVCHQQAWSKVSGLVPASAGRVPAVPPRCAS